MLKPGKELLRRTPFSRIPKALLDPAALPWRPICSGRWAWADPVVLGEGRSSNRLLELLSQVSRAHRTLFLSLQDNQTWAGAAGKGRSAAPQLNYLCRRRTALECATGIDCRLPWVQSPSMPADSLSRAIGSRDARGVAALD